MGLEGYINNVLVISKEVQVPVQNRLVSLGWGWGRGQAKLNRNSLTSFLSVLVLLLCLTLNPILKLHFFVVKKSVLYWMQIIYGEGENNIELNANFNISFKWKDTEKGR